MKHVVDNATGVVVFIPENAQDRKALFHIMDCSDLTHFSEYIKTLGEQESITQDLGVTAREIYSYTEQPEITETALIGFNRR